MRKKQERTREFLLIELLPRKAIYILSFLLFFYSFKRGRRYLENYNFFQRNITSANISKNDSAFISLHSEDVDSKVKAIFIYLNQTNLTKNNKGKYDHGFCTIKLNRTVIYNSNRKVYEPISLSEQKAIEEKRKETQNIVSYDEEKIVAYSPHKEFPAFLYPVYFPYGTHDYLANLSLEWSEKKAASFVIGFNIISYKNYDFVNILKKWIIITYILCFIYNIIYIRVSQWLVLPRLLLLLLGILTELEIPYAWTFLVRFMRIYLFFLIHLAWKNSTKPDIAFIIFFGLVNCYELHYSLIDAQINDYTYKYSMDLFDIGLSLYLFIISFPCKVKGASNKVLSFLFIMCLTDAICSLCHGKYYAYAHFHQLLPILNERIRYLNVFNNLIIVLFTSSAPFIKKPYHEDEIGLLTEDIKDQMYMENLKQI